MLAGAECKSAPSVARFRLPLSVDSLSMRVTLVTLTFVCEDGADTESTVPAITAPAVESAMGA